MINQIKSLLGIPTSADLTHAYETGQRHMAEQIAESMDFDCYQSTKIGFTADLDEEEE